MPSGADEQSPHIEAYARLTADIAGYPPGTDAQRLAALRASALQAQQRSDPMGRMLGRPPTRLHTVLPEGTGDAILAELESGAGASGEAIALVRRDEREMVLTGRIVDSFSGLVPTERLGPFPTHGGTEVLIDVFGARSRRTEVRERGSATPLLVLTSARAPVPERGSTTIELEAGTVWVRGNLIDESLPAGAFAGITIEGGSLVLEGETNVTRHVVEVRAPLKGVLKIEPAVDEVESAPGVRPSSAAIALPDSLSFTFGGGDTSIEGVAGTATVWGQTFSFSQPTGTSTFIEPLWSVVLECSVKPQKLDAGPAEDELLRLDGVASVTGAGLGLPVVVATDPAVLGAAATSASWFLTTEGLSASWYDDDPRAHALGSARVRIASHGTTILAEAVRPLSPPVSHVYNLWATAGDVGHRLPWHQTYTDLFPVFHQRDVVEGERLMVQGQADVALDRPVTTAGIPVPTSATQGTVRLHRLGSSTTAVLGARLAEDDSTLQLALRNALVWTTAPSAVVVHGSVQGGSRVDSGNLQILLGVRAWAPTLPDPYVSDAFVVGKHVTRAVPRAQLVARVDWRDPARTTVSFEGRLGSSLAMNDHVASAGEPHPAPGAPDDPDIGLTQTKQGSLALGGTAAKNWAAAQLAAEKDRQRRRERAEGANNNTAAIIDGYLEQALGTAPQLVLLDVSTNHDLLGVAVGGQTDAAASRHGATGSFPVSGLDVQSQVAGLRVIALPQVQWEPVRTLDEDQDITLSMLNEGEQALFPTPLASATDGGATEIGARYQKLVPVGPSHALQGTIDAFHDDTPVAFKTTFPFGLVGAGQLLPEHDEQRAADLYGLTRPVFDDDARGGIQVTAHAEGGRPDVGGVSPTFEGVMRQWLNGVDLASGDPRYISVLGDAYQGEQSVESLFNKRNEDKDNPSGVPVTRIDISGYGGSSFSDWNNPFAAFAEVAKVQFRVVTGRTALEVVKVNSVLHPWGVRVTRSVTVERRPGGGVIRRDSGWEAFTPGLFDYRYANESGEIDKADYGFDAGMFRGLFNVRTIRPAPGAVFQHGDGGDEAELVPYYFDADVALEGVPGRTPATGVLGYLQIGPQGAPAAVDALRKLLEQQGPIGGPLDVWLDLGGSGLAFRARRIEVGLAMDGNDPLFVATVRGTPKLPNTGAWSVVVRSVENVPLDGGEAVPVADSRGVPVVRRYPVAYAKDEAAHDEPPLVGDPGPHRFADAADLLTPSLPANEYGLLQSTPTHAFLFPRPYIPTGTKRIDSGHKPALADILARSTSKGAFPPPGNTIETVAGSVHLVVGPTGKLALNAPLSIVGHHQALRLGGTTGGGSVLDYSDASLWVALTEDLWEAELSGLRIWTDIAGLERLTGSQMRIVGSTNQRSQVAELKTLMPEAIENVLRYLPIFDERGVQGPVDLGATNARHLLKFEVGVGLIVPPVDVPVAGLDVKLKLLTMHGFVYELGAGVNVASSFSAELEGKVPIFTTHPGLWGVFVVVSLRIRFSLELAPGSVTSNKTELVAFVGVGIEGYAGLKAYAFIGIGFILVYDAVADQPKYGAMVAVEAGISLGPAKVKVRGELPGLVYYKTDDGTVNCEYGGSVKVQADLAPVLSISASYQITDTIELYNPEPVAP
jgi:hypothetical protein